MEPTKTPAELLDELLRREGAAAWGATPARAVDDDEWALFEKWLENGWNAGMAYMRNYPEIRRDPRLLLDGAKTIISIAYNFRQANPMKGVATFAVGEDYHKALRRRLKRVVGEMKEVFGGDWRICIDSAPILERYWARQCGVGRRNPRNGSVTVAGVGSMVFLAEILWTGEWDMPEKAAPPEPNISGTGIETKSRAQCPTGALHDGVVDCRRCITYLTIEHRGDLSDEERRLAGATRYGCDICQTTDPDNSGDFPPIIPELRPLTEEEWALKKLRR